MYAATMLAPSSVKLCGAKPTYLSAVRVLMLLLSAKIARSCAVVVNAAPVAPSMTYLSDPLVSNVSGLVPVTLLSSIVTVASVASG